MLYVYLSKQSINLFNDLKEFIIGSFLMLM